MTERKIYMGVDMSPLLAINTLSGLVEAIVHAGENIDRTTHYPDAHDWHVPDEALGLCRVCDAGAVLAVLCSLPPSTLMSGVIENRSILETRMFAMDRIRKGEFMAATECLNIGLTFVQDENLWRINSPHAPHWIPDPLLGTQEKTNSAWTKFDLHIADLRDRVLPTLKALGL